MDIRASKPQRWDPESDRPASGKRRRIAAKATTINAAVSSLGGIVNATLSASILAICARDGQSHEIAAYTVATSILSFVSIAAGGGGPLLYVTGNEDQRAAVRSRWIVVVLPALLVGSLLLGWFYSGRGYTWQPLMCASLVMIGNSIGQFQIGDLTRRLKFGISSVLVCGAKLAGLLLAIFGMPMTLALLVATCVQFVAGEVILKGQAWTHRRNYKEVSFRRAISSPSVSGNLLLFTTSELYNSRVASIALSFFVSPTTMGAFGAVISVYQALAGVVDTALRAPMAAKVRERHGPARSRSDALWAELALVGAATASACLLVLCAPWLTRDVLRLESSQATWWLTTFALAVPFMATNHAFVFDRVARGKYRHAMLISCVTSALLTASLAWAVPVFREQGAAIGSLASEILTTLIVVAVFTYSKVSRSGQRPTTL